MPAYGAAYNGTFVGVVVPKPADGPNGLYVRVPRLNQDAVMGPCEAVASWVLDEDGIHVTSAAPPRFHSGQRVLVATVAGSKDVVVVLGPIG